MKRSDKTRFTQLLWLLGGVHRVEITDVMIEGYWSVLRDMELEEYEKRVAANMKDSQWFPKPGELRNRGADYKRDLRRRARATSKMLEAPTDGSTESCDESETSDTSVRVGGLIASDATRRTPPG